MRPAAQHEAYRRRRAGDRVARCTGGRALHNGAQGGNFNPSSPCSRRLSPAPPSPMAQVVPVPAPAAAVAVDSIVLECTPCYRSCPAYQLRLSGTGEVRFQARSGGSILVVDRVEPAAVAALAREAERIGFAALPPQVRDVPALCGNMATDHPPGDRHPLRGRAEPEGGGLRGVPRDGAGAARAARAGGTHRQRRADRAAGAAARPAIGAGPPRTGPWTGQTGIHHPTHSDLP